MSERNMANENSILREKIQRLELQMQTIQHNNEMLKNTISLVNKDCEELSRQLYLANETIEDMQAQVEFYCDIFESYDPMVNDYIMDMLEPDIDNIVNNGGKHG